MRRVFLALVALAGCETVSTDRNLLPTCSTLGGTWAGLALDSERASNLSNMARYAEPYELVDWFGEDTALRIVRARPFKTDPVSELVLALDPETVEELADTAFDAWCRLDDGRQSCCVDLDATGLGQEASGVQIDDQDAFALLSWANAATHDELVAVCGVGDGIAERIREARPLRTIHELDRVAWVGPDSLARMVGYEACVSEPSAIELWCEVEPDLCDTL